MRLFRAKSPFQTAMGSVHKGQLFLVGYTYDLPIPQTGGNLVDAYKNNYEEIVSPSKLYSLQSIIKIQEIK